MLISNLNAGPHDPQDQSPITPLGRGSSRDHRTAGEPQGRGGAAWPQTPFRVRSRAHNLQHTGDYIGRFGGVTLFSGNPATQIFHTMLGNQYLLRNPFD